MSDAAFPTPRRRFLGHALALSGSLIAPAYAAQGAQRARSPLPGSSPVKLARSWYIDIDALGTRRRIFIACPDTPPPASGYPALFVLDGNALFPLLAQQMRLLTARPESGPLNPPLIVGLGYPGEAPYDQDARAADYTLAPLLSGGIEKPGAAHFLDFITERVAPLLRAHLPLDTARTTLFGHSYGGLFTLYALFSQTPLFRHFVAASPSLWWGDGAIGPWRDRYLAKVEKDTASTTPRSLLITAGELEETNSPALTPRAKRQAKRRVVSTARAITKSLQGMTSLDATFLLLSEADHGSVVLPTSALALHRAANTSPGIPS